MGSTYLNITNAVIRRFSDVELTSVNFAAATTYHAYVKDVVNDVIREIQQTERQWPFNHQTKTQTLTVDEQEYPWPTIADGDDGDAEAIDWDTFFLVRDDTLSISQKKLENIDYDEYLERHKSRAENMIITGTNLRVPKLIYRAQNNNWGVDIKPDREYQVSYEYWGYPSELTAFNNTTTIPSRFDWIIKHGCYSELYGQRGDPGMKDRYANSYRKGLDNMVELLINKPSEFRDGRVGIAG